MNTEELDLSGMMETIAMDMLAASGKEVDIEFFIFTVHGRLGSDAEAGAGAAGQPEHTSYCHHR